MGIVGLLETQQMEIEEFRRLLLSCAGVRKRKEEEEEQFGDQPQRAATGDGNDTVTGEKLVCVTSGVSFLGLAIVSRLLIRGFSVRLMVTNEEDRERLREMELSGEMRGANNNNISTAMANLNDVQSLSEAFDGCRGVFHTAAFVDPAGLSGYSKSMADIEVKATENVMEACARTSSVRSCVLTSSLLACIWRDKSRGDLSSLVNHECWSDESVCIEKKLWCALGKLRAEKAAWRIAEQNGFKLVTICPGLITGPEFLHRNPTATVAYLKGGKEMYADGLLATVDVNRLGDAHVSLFEAMNTEAFGRYICFDRVIRREDEVENLAGETGMQTNMILGNASGNVSFRFELTNVKLTGLMSRTVRCSIES
ncbi:cinnamoyl-CoA reductase-like SNL6 [Actinidia eriantha]|uniref:cinnamoyl-CoA reductase-like SNL6 n=1 Tax=Actinidia eriantha TaxID=165200 RepID=UPI00258FAAB9|nr:cinnamoyl-CoA reductase-like SNL6 [Actinidia eriantha]